MSTDFHADLGDCRQQAREALHAEPREPELILLALRELDEPRPREMAELLAAIVDEARRLERVVEAGQGASQQAEQATRKLGFLQRHVPKNVADVDKLAAELAETDRELRDARRREQDAVQAAGHLAGLHRLCPRLFHADPPEDRRRVDPNNPWFAPPEIANRIRQLPFALELVDGWLRSTLPARDDSDPEPVRLTTAGTMKF